MTCVLIEEESFWLCFFGHRIGIFWSLKKSGRKNSWCGIKKEQKIARSWYNSSNGMSPHMTKSHVSFWRREIFMARPDENPFLWSKHFKLETLDNGQRNTVFSLKGIIEDTVLQTTHAILSTIQRDICDDTGMTFKQKILWKNGTFSRINKHHELDRQGEFWNFRVFSRSGSYINISLLFECLSVIASQKSIIFAKM